jgi:hypothetical protein
VAEPIGMHIVAVQRDHFRSEQFTQVIKRHASSPELLDHDPLHHVECHLNAAADASVFRGGRLLVRGK